jgi:Flp pilus assembly protein TadD
MFRRAVQFHPDSPAAHNNLAQTLLDQRRYDDAERSARRAVELAGSGAMAETTRQTLEQILKARAPAATTPQSGQ